MMGVSANGERELPKVDWANNREEAVATIVLPGVLVRGTSLHTLVHEPEGWLINGTRPATPQEMQMWKALTDE